MQPAQNDRDGRSRDPGLGGQDHEGALWLLALPLSYPGALAFSKMVGDTLMGTPLDFDYSIAGALLWLIIVVFLSALASLWPAWSATRVSVRAALAYE